ncbi:MAG: YciI family protein [Myxococcales bacterium]|nr:YciI family protein [Myxococcales bacterium]
MRFMIMMKANHQTEAGEMPSPELLAAMGAFNEEMVKAGVLLAGEGLHPSSRGARVKFAGGSHTVVDGPFSETKELIAGFWIVQVASKAEALEWIARIPGGRGEIDHQAGEFEVELRQVFDPSDFAYAPEAVAHEEALRAQVEAQRRP